MKHFASKKVLLGAAAGLMMAMAAMPSLVSGATAVKISGSTTVFPVSQAVIAAGGWTDMTLSGGGSGQGRTDVINKVVDIGNSSGKASAAQLELLDEWIVARDMITIIVDADFYDDLVAANGGNDINITPAQLDTLYEQGANITNYTWGDFIPTLEPTNPVADEKIIPVARIVGSGTRDTFMSKCGITSATEETTMSAVESAYGIIRQAENQGVYDMIEADTGSYGGQSAHLIGYIGLGYVDEYVKGLKINNVEPVAANFSSYFFSRDLYAYTLKKQYRPADDGYNMRAMDFVEFMLSPAGQAAVPATGFISVARSLTTTPCWWDIAGTNKKMDALDFSALSSNWNTTGTPGDPNWTGMKADLNNNGTVDVPDFSKLSSLWGSSWNY